MDLTLLFKDITVAGLPLVGLVLALVQYIKGFGLSGNIIKLLSLGVGFVLGIGYQLSVSMPVDFGGWFVTTIFGLGLGLVASGGYDAITSAVKAASEPVTPVVK